MLEYHDVEVFMKKVKVFLNSENVTERVGYVNMDFEELQGRIDDNESFYLYDSNGNKSVLIINPDLIEILEDESTSVESPSTEPTPPSQPATQPVSPVSGPLEPVPMKTTRSFLGTNLGEFRDWNPSYPFVDLMKQSRNWISGAGTTWNDQRTVEVDENGWVVKLLNNQVARTVVYTYGSDFSLPWQRLHVYYDGQGTLEYVGVRKNETLSDVNHEIVDVTDRRMYVYITSTNSSDPIRNIRVIPEGMHSYDKTYRPEYLHSLENYSNIRFMHWMITNDQHGTMGQWNNRSKVSDSNWTLKGPPVEVMVELCNTLQSDPWFTLSHLVSDQDVLAFARLVKELLNPNLKVYVEYSNEVWNNQFPQSRWVESQGVNASLGNNPFQSRLFWYSRRSTEVFSLWKSVFAGEEERVVGVMGSQAYNAWTSEQVLGYENAHLVTDALAIAPYFGQRVGQPTNESLLSSMTLNSFMDYLQSSVLKTAYEAMEQSQRVAERFKVPLIGYEGGQHLVAMGSLRNNNNVTRLFSEANRNPRMKELYRQYLNHWEKVTGGTLFNHFTHCYPPNNAYGYWGSLEHLFQSRSNAPKYDALMSFIEERQ